MRIFFDQRDSGASTSTPARSFNRTAFEMGWAQLKNGELLAAAEAQFDLMISTDQNLRYQQNLTGRKIAIIVLMTTSWPRIEAGVQKVRDEVNAITAGEYREIIFP